MQFVVKYGVRNVHIFFMLFMLFLCFVHFFHQTERHSNSDKLIYSLALELNKTFISESHLFLTLLFNMLLSHAVITAHILFTHCVTHMFPPMSIARH